VNRRRVVVDEAGAIDDLVGDSGGDPPLQSRLPSVSLDSTAVGSDLRSVLYDPGRVDADPSAVYNDRSPVYVDHHP
jgi:hypothetical protein